MSAGHFDVVVLGGTLGILLAAALLAHSSRHSAQGSSQPLRVAVVERGELVGREQEWNCTQADLQVVRGCRYAVLWAAHHSAHCSLKLNGRLTTCDGGVI